MKEMESGTRREKGERRNGEAGRVETRREIERKRPSTETTQMHVE